jgi:succinate dehydrogenase / fumarate reductase membrane anchor subunit
MAGGESSDGAVAERAGADSNASGIRPAYRGAEARPTRDRRRIAAFVLVRFTGLLLTALVLGHFAVTHLVNDVADTDAAFVARRWGSALWLTWDWLMLVAAIVHGAAGVSVAIDDYATDGARRGRYRRILIGLSAVALAVGTATILAAIPT